MRPLLALVIVATLAQPARADLASSIYGDVRDVIEELIQTEVATSVVRTIEERSPALAFYMHGTLERLGSPYWGSLARVLKDDLTIAVSDFVYWHVSTGGGDGDVVASARRFFGCVTQHGPSSDACTRLHDAVTVQHRPLIEVECRRTKPPADRRVACHVGLAVLAALQGRGEVRQHLVDALADIVLSEVADRDVGGRMRVVLTAWLDLPKDLPTPLLEALANPDLAAELTDDAIDKRCSDPKLIDTLLADPAGPLSWVCFAVTHTALPKALVASVRIRENGKEIHRKIDFWLIEAALKDFDPDHATDDTAFRLFTDQVFDVECPAGVTPLENTWPCSGTRLGPGAVIYVNWIGKGSFGVVNPNGVIETKSVRALLSPVLRFRKLMRRVEALRAIVPPSLQSTLFYAGTTPTIAKAALRAAHRMARLVTELRSRWYLWAQNARAATSFEELDVAELLHVARASLDPANTQGSTALAFLDKQAVGGAATIDIGDWLRMVMRADYRSLAMETLRAALNVRLGNSHRPHETFFLSLAAYLLDNTDGVGEAVARSAFRASAKELLLSASHRGVPRPDDPIRFRLLPRLALRLSFSDTYAATDNGEGKRTVVAADWPTLMASINDYVGVELSVLDPVAPLAEMALRPAGRYERPAYVLLDAVRPRLGMWIAVPSLSRRLALTAGFGVRFLDVTRLDDGAAGTTLAARYGYRASLTFDAGVQFVF
jgi:hypothetical protein